MPQVYFSKFPTILFQILDRDDIIMFLVIAGFGANGCYISYENWKERHQIGSDAVNRSRKKLEFLNLIRVERRTEMVNGIPHKLHRSFAVTNPYEWRLTKDLNREIQDQSRKLKSPVGIFSKVPFENIDDFESQFNEKYPNLRVRRQGRQVDETPLAKNDAQIDKLNVSKAVATIERPNLWKTFLRNLQVPDYPFVDLIRKYIFYGDDILKIRNGVIEHHSSDQVEYFRELERIYVERCKGVSAKESELCALVESLQFQGLDNDSIIGRINEFEINNFG